MSSPHQITAAAERYVRMAIERGEDWVAYNALTHTINQEDIFCFTDKKTAQEFAIDNYSDFDQFNVVHMNEFRSLLGRIDINQNNNSKLEMMNERNVDFLKDNLKYLGFGEGLNEQLEQQIRAQKPEFSIQATNEFGNRGMEATLHFRKSTESDFYFLNKYDTRLQTEKNESLSQTFFLDKGWGVTVKEAYNLLNGRAVHKEMNTKDNETYKAWIQLDFSAKDKYGNYERKQFHENYGYDLKEALSYFPIKEMQQADSAEKLIRSLERGNLQAVTLNGPGKEARYFLEANPQYKSVTIYDVSMKRLGQEARQDLMVKPRLGQSQNIESKAQPQVAQVDLSAKKQEKKMDAKESQAEKVETPGLVEKKRQGKKKGLSA